MSTSWKEKVAARFDGAAEDYDRYSDVQAEVANRLAASLPEIDQPRILEIGCGTGTLTRDLLNKYPDATFEITDISPRMIDQAKALTSVTDTLNWSVMDGENPSCEGTFDLIVSNMTVQWFENPDEALKNLLTYLKPGGQLFYAVPGPYSFKEWQETLKGLGLPSGILNFAAWPGVFKEEEHNAQYDSALDFLRSVKAIGAGTSRPGYKALGYTDMRRACKRFDQEFQGLISWQILYGRLFND